MAESLQVTLEKIRRRDEAAIAELVTAHHHSLRGYVAALSASIDSIDDLAQEVFLRALQRLDRVENLEDFPRFLRGIARNVILEERRKHSTIKQRYVEFIDELFTAEETTPGDSPFRDPTIVQSLLACISKLTPKSQRMLSLRYKEEMPANEIGAELGMNGGAVRISLLRARETLLKCLRSEASQQLSEAGL